MKTLSMKVLSEKVFISYPEQRQNSSLWIFRTQLYLYICLRRFKDVDRKPKQDLRPPAITLGYADLGVISLESFRAATNNRHPTELILSSTIEPPQQAQLPPAGIPLRCRQSAHKSVRTIHRAPGLPACRTVTIGSWRWRWPRCLSTCGQAV